VRTEMSSCSYSAAAAITFRMNRPPAVEASMSAMTRSQPSFLGGGEEGRRLQRGPCQAIELRGDDRLSSPAAHGLQRELEAGSALGRGADAGILEGIDQLPAVLLARRGDRGALSVESETAGRLLGSGDADVSDGEPGWWGHGGEIVAKPDG
jgi:hypothetical protein